MDFRLSAFIQLEEKKIQLARIRLCIPDTSPHTSSPKWTCSRNLFFVLFHVPTSVGVRDRILFSRVLIPLSVGARDMMQYLPVS